MASIELKNITKIYPSPIAHGHFFSKRVEKKEDVVAVKDFSLKIQDREFVVLVGPSGCGKSTTLRMIAGLEEISQGELYIDGRLVNDEESKDRDIAMVFQNYALYPHMSVFENMAFAIRKRVSDKKEVERKVLEAATILGISDYLDIKPRNLSGGQRQRVAIGRAIVRNPKVMLMDEPLSNLDAKLRNQMRTEIMKLRERIDATFVYVTHDQTEAMTLGDRIVVMKDGMIQQIGRPDEVYDNPRNLFVASFIGEPQINTIPCSMERNDNGFSLKIFSSTLPLPLSFASYFEKSGESFVPLVMGIRAQDIIVGRERGEFSATVTLFERNGSDTLLHFEYEGMELVAVVDERETGRFSMGEKVYFSIPEDSYHLFLKESGLNVLWREQDE